MSNLIQIGLDVTSFSEDKKKAMNEFISLFEKLDVYSEKVYSPVLGSGLLEFNKSVSDTNKIIDEMNSKLVNLETSIKNIQSSSSSSAKSQTELSLAMQEYKKQVDDAAKLNAKLAVTTSEQAKENAELRQQLSEKTKALVDEARANTDSAKAKKANAQAEKELKEEESQRLDALKAEIAIEENQALESKRNNIKAEKELKEERRQMVDAMKAEIIIQEEAAAAKVLDEKRAKELANDYIVLTKALKEQAAAYQQVAASKGVNSPEAKASLAQYKETASIVGTIDDNLSKANGSTKLFGGALSGAFSQLRNIAYILPGIGIAGLFTLAFEAIEKAAEALGVFSTELDKEMVRETKINDALTERLSLLEQINEASKKDASFQQIDQNTKVKRVEDLTSRGFAQDVTLPKLVEISKQTYEDFKKQSGGKTQQEIFELVINLKKQIDDLEKVSGNINAKDSRGFTDYLADLFDKGGLSILPGSDVYKKSVEGQKVGTPEELEHLKENVNSKIKLYQQELNQKLKFAQEYTAAYDNMLKLQAEYNKFNSDEDRKAFIDRRKSELSVVIDNNSKIADSDLSTQKEKLDAIEKIKNAQVSLNQVTRISITGTDENENKSTTKKSKDESYLKEKDDNLKVLSDFHKREDTINREFYQRALKSEKEAGDTEIRERARLHKEAAENEKLSMEERLEAEYNYLSDLKVLQEREFQLNVKRGQIKNGGRVSLTKEEIEVEEKKKAEQQSSIEANAQNEIRQIVTSSSKLLLKEVLDNNRLQEEDNRRAHAQELEDFATSFKNKEISYQEYNKRILETNKKFRKQGLESDVENDLQEINRLKVLRNNSQSQLLKDQDDFNKEEDIARKKRLQGKLDAEKESLKNIDIAIITAQEKLGKDSLDLAELNAKKEIDIQKQIADEKKAIIEELFNLAKSAVDSQYENEIANIEKAREVKNQDYDKEIASVQQSTLSMKDKQALEVQLKEKKIEDDKKAQAEERKLKREQAEIDRALTIAHILWSTEESAALALATIPFPFGEQVALERRILGGIQIATVLATKIPSFAEGTDYFEGGLARYGEAGPELVKEPYKSPYLVMKETISYLPKGTEIIPMKDDISFNQNKVDDSWEQTRWLARQMKKNKQEIKNSFNPTINIDLSFELYKNKILGN
jgi:hypothetical protein